MDELKKVKLTVDGTTDSAAVTTDGKIAMGEELLQSMGYSLTWSADGKTATLSQDKKSGMVLTAEEEKLVAIADKYADLIEDVSLKIHAKPQLCFEERFACDLLCSVLEEHGFAVERNIKGIHPSTKEEWKMETAFVASMDGKGDGPTIALMLEYDALPMGHACGHNTIAASGLTAALALAEVMPEIGGKLKVMGTPAEEGGGGKVHMLEAGHFEGVDLALITHPGDRWATGAEFLATKSATMVYKGVPAHAAAAPHKGVSALDAAVIAYNAIEMQREHVRDDARIHGIIKDGGQASNIVPERAEMAWGVRALDNVYLETLVEKVTNCAKAGALATGAELEINWGFEYGAPINVDKLDELVIGYAQALNAGPIMGWDSLGSSDLGNVGFVLPTCNLWFAIAEEGVMPHTHPFMEAAKTKEATEATIKAGKAIMLSAVRLFKDADLLGVIKKDFAANKQKLMA